MQETAVEEPGELATPGDVLGRAAEVKPGRGAYLAPHSDLVYASLTGRVRTVPPPPGSPDQVGSVSSVALCEFSGRRECERWGEWNGRKR